MAAVIDQDTPTPLVSPFGAAAPSAPAAPIPAEIPDDPGVAGEIDKMFDAKQAAIDEAAKPAPVKPEPAKAPETPTATETKPESVKEVKDPLLADLEPAKPKVESKKPAIEAKKEEAPAADEPKNIKEFRNSYDKLKSERDTIKAEADALRKQLSEHKTVDAEAVTKPLKEERDKLVKQIEELETKVKYHDYTKSSEYQTKFHEPLVNAWQSALDDIKGVVVPIEGGEDPDATREATAEDIKQIVALPTLAAATRAKQLFGDAASEILSHRKNILNLAKAKDAALNEWKTKGSELEVQTKKQREELERTTRETYFANEQAWQKDQPQYFAEDPEDGEGNTKLDQGRKLVKMAMFGEGVPEGMTPQARHEYLLRVQSLVANRAAAFSREVHRNQTLQAKLAAAEAKLAAFKASDPEPGKTTKVTGTVSNVADADKGLDQRWDEAFPQQ